MINVHNKNNELTTKFTVLTTSPSINISNNVSGIANLTRLWVENNNNVRYLVFVSGKKDNQKRNGQWLIMQPFIALEFLKKIIVNKDISVIHINMPLEKFAIIKNFGFSIIASLFHKPQIVHLRGGFYNQKDNVPLVIKWLIKRSLNNANKIIVLGNQERNYFSKKYSISNDEFLVLPNCVKVPENIQIEEQKPATFNILFLGRLDKNKGLEEIAESLSSLPLEINYKLKIAGDGPDKDWFLDLCNKKIKKSIQYMGVVSGLEKVELIKTSHIFLLPSYYEGLPNALLEAMSYGVVPVVTPVGSIPEVVKHRQNGLLVEINDHASISEAIIQLYDNYALFKELSMNAHQTIAKNYSLENYLVVLNELYNDIAHIND